MLYSKASTAGGRFFSQFAKTSLKGVKNMSLAPILSAVGGVSNLAGLFSVTNGGQLFEDNSITRDEFSQMLLEVMTNLTSEELEGEEATEKAEELANNLGPMIFGLFDKDGNGVIEGEEVESMRSMLSYFNPDILRNAMEKQAETPEGELPVLSAVGETLPGFLS